MAANHTQSVVEMYVTEGMPTDPADETSMLFAIKTIRMQASEVAKVHPKAPIRHV